MAQVVCLTSYSTTSASENAAVCCGKRNANGRKSKHSSWSKLAIHKNNHNIAVYTVFMPYSTVWGTPIGAISQVFLLG
eukprot:scaffold1389_cov251-Ochromonas_danica.AAC.4